MNEWIKWPAITGWYWFYGVSSKAYNRQPELGVVRAYATVSEKIVVVYDAEVLINDRADGMFLRIDEPLAIPIYE